MMLPLIEAVFIAVLSAILFLMYSRGVFSIKNRFRRAVINGSWTGKERRQHVRFKNDLEVRYTEKKRQAVSDGKTVDISMGGLRLLLEEKLSKGAVLLVRIMLPDGKRPVEARGEIVWSEETDGNGSDGKRMFHAGIRFLDVKKPSDAHLLKYLRSLPQSAEAA